MKIERLITIIFILLNKNKISANELADILEVSVRTIYRDIQALSQAGIPTSTLPGVNGGIQMMEQYKIDKQFFTSSDITTLLIALNSLSTALLPFQINTIFEKIKTLIPKTQLREVEHQTNQINIDLTAWMKESETLPVLETIKNSLDHSKLLNFQYKNNHGQISQRTVEPYQLFLKENNWYLYAYCREKNDFRIFKLAKITHLTTTTGFIHRKKAFLSEMTKNMHRPKKNILLRVTPQLKEHLEDKFGQLSFRKIKNSTFFLVDFPFQEDEFGYRLLLSFGNQCECLSPDSVREELQKRLTELLALYQG